LADKFGPNERFQGRGQLQKLQQLQHQLQQLLLAVVSEDLKIPVSEDHKIPLICRFILISFGAGLQIYSDQFGWFADLF
jgi:hypothetical protein